MSSPREFQYRGADTTRLEAFVDAAFAFVLTLLVISFDAIPSSYEDLLLALRGVPAFLAGFWIITMFWLAHRSWSNRFGLDTSLSTLLSLGLVFVMLVYVYPLRTVMAAAFSHLTAGWAPIIWELSSIEELRGLFTIYSAGFALASLLVAALNWHALRQSDMLGLSDFEAYRTRSEVLTWLLMSATGWFSIAIATLAPNGYVEWAGWVYCLMPIAIFLLATFRRRREP